MANGGFNIVLARAAAGLAGRWEIAAMISREQQWSPQHMQ
jgi:hypothetical protein